MFDMHYKFQQNKFVKNCPKTISELKTHPLQEFFFYTTFGRCTKYHEADLVSMLELQKNVPSHATVLKAIPTFKVKPMDIKNVYDLVCQLCSHKGYQVHGLDFEETHAPEVSSTYLRIFIALCAALQLK